jgi:predicted metal-dependent hydrolase
MNFDILQEMWEKDSVIDPDNLHLESIKIPILHSKYYKIFNQLKIQQKEIQYELSKIKRDRYEYYGGKASAEIYVEEPFPYKIRDKETMNRYLEADEKLNKFKAKNEYIEMMINYIEDILKVILNRTYQIKNAIEFMQFTAGYS